VINVETSERESRAADIAAEPDPRVLTVVTALATTPVKGLRITARSEVMLSRAGVTENRRFYLIDENARMVNGKKIGALAAVCADYDADTNWLTMIFPDGAEIADTARLGAKIRTQFFSRIATAHLVHGPWSDRLSSYTGTQLRLVESHPDEGGVDRGRTGAVSLISRASIARLEALAARAIDPRRFRMLIEITGTDAHQEDDWVGHTVQIGAARVAIRGHVGRCLVTSQSPDSGIVDMPTLKLLSYRRNLQTTEALAFGVYGEVLEAGPVRVGDTVSGG
jgi:uncharacterized protein